VVAAVVAALGGVEHGERDGLGLCRIDNSVREQLAIGSDVVGGCTDQKESETKASTYIEPVRTVVAGIAGATGRLGQHGRGMGVLGNSRRIGRIDL
jgi:hypothetical protein